MAGGGPGERLQSFPLEEGMGILAAEINVDSGQIGAVTDFGRRELAGCPQLLEQLLKQFPYQQDRAALSDTEFPPSVLCPEPDPS